MLLIDIITKVDSLKAELDSLRPISEDAMNRFYQKINLDWNYHSNSIEGNTLSLSETRSLLLHGITANGKPMRDHMEMKGHNEALKKLEDIAHKELTITESRIKEFHKMILVEPYQDENAEIKPGEYKTRSNYLYTSTGERIDFEPPQEVPRLMNELVNWLNNHIESPKRKKKKYDLHPILIAAGFHAQFIKIHPFGDGNGRTARIVMNLILMMTGYVPAIIKLDDRDNYYNALNTSTIDDAENLAIFIGKETIKSLELMIKAANGESIEEVDDLDKKLALLQKEIDAEDDSNKIKETLSEKVLFNVLNNSIFELIHKLSDTAIKFNSFYNNPNHSISFFRDGSGNRIAFNESISLKKVSSFKPKEDNNKLRNAELSISLNFGHYIKGGLNPFKCNYDVQVRFEEIHYKISVPKFIKETGGQEKIEIKKLLHQSLSEVDIEEINKIWGDTLLSHLQYNMAKLKENKK